MSVDRQLSDNQIIQRFSDDRKAHDEMECVVHDNKRMIAELHDEFSAFSRHTEQQMKGLSDCINDIKVLQYDQSRMMTNDGERRDERQHQQDFIYREIVDEFKFRRKLSKWRNSLLLTLGMILGLVISAQGIWDTVKHLFVPPKH